MPLLLLHFLVIHVGDNFARNGVCLSLSPLLSPPSGILKNSRKLVDNGSRRRIYEETWNYSRLVFHLTKSNLLESKKKESKSVSFRSKTSYYHPSNTSFRIDPISIWYPLFSKQRRGEILQRGLAVGIPCAATPVTGKQVKLEERPRVRPSIEISTAEGPKLALIRGVSRGRDSSPCSSSSLNKYRLVFVERISIARACIKLVCARIHVAYSYREPVPRH